MRNYLLILLSAISLISCEVNYTAPEELNTKQVFRFVVKQTDWVELADEDGLNRYYRYKFTLDGITQYMIDNGAAIGYIEFDGFQQQLPFSRHFENLDGARWTRTVDFDFSKNDVQFYVTNDDFIKDRPETMYFRVVFIW